MMADYYITSEGEVTTSEKEFEESVAESTPEHQRSEELSERLDDDGGGSSSSPSKSEPSDKSSGKSAPPAKRAKDTDKGSTYVARSSGSGKPSSKTQEQMDLAREAAEKGMSRQEMKSYVRRKSGEGPRAGAYSAYSKTKDISTSEETVESYEENIERVESAEEGTEFEYGGERVTKSELKERLQEGKGKAKEALKQRKEYWEDPRVIFKSGVQQKEEYKAVARDEKGNITGTATVEGQKKPDQGAFGESNVPKRGRKDQYINTPEEAQEAIIDVKKSISDIKESKAGTRFNIGGEKLFKQQALDRLKQEKERLKEWRQDYLKWQEENPDQFKIKESFEDVTGQRAIVNEVKTKEEAQTEKEIELGKDYYEKLPEYRKWTAEGQTLFSGGKSAEYLASLVHGKDTSKYTYELLGEQELAKQKGGPLAVYEKGVKEFPTSVPGIASISAVGGAGISYGIAGISSISATAGSAAQVTATGAGSAVVGLGLGKAGSLYQKGKEVKGTAKLIEIGSAVGGAYAGSKAGLSEFQKQYQPKIKEVKPLSKKQMKAYTRGKGGGTGETTLVQKGDYAAGRAGAPYQVKYTQPQFPKSIRGTATKKGIAFVDVPTIQASPKSTTGIAKARFVETKGGKLTTRAGKQDFLFRTENIKNIKPTDFVQNQLVKTRISPLGKGQGKTITSQVGTLSKVQTPTGTTRTTTVSGGTSPGTRYAGMSKNLIINLDNIPQGSVSYGTGGGSSGPYTVKAPQSYVQTTFKTSGPKTTPQEVQSVVTGIAKSTRTLPTTSYKGGRVVAAPFYGREGSPQAYQAQGDISQVDENVGIQEPQRYSPIESTETPNKVSILSSEPSEPGRISVVQEEETYTDTYKTETQETDVVQETSPTDPSNIDTSVITHSPGKVYTGQGLPERTTKRGVYLGRETSGRGVMGLGDFEGRVKRRQGKDMSEMSFGTMVFGKSRRKDKRKVKEKRPQRGKSRGKDKRKVKEKRPQRVMPLVAQEQYRTRRMTQLPKMRLQSKVRGKEREKVARFEKNVPGLRSSKAEKEGIVPKGMQMPEVAQGQKPKGKTTLRTIPKMKAPKKPRKPQKTTGMTTGLPGMPDFKKKRGGKKSTGFKDLFYTEKEHPVATGKQVLFGKKRKKPKKSKKKGKKKKKRDFESVLFGG